MRMRRQPLCLCRGQLCAPALSVAPLAGNQPMPCGEEGQVWLLLFDTGVWSSAPTTCPPSWPSPSASPTVACSARRATPCAGGFATTCVTSTCCRSGEGARDASHPAGIASPYQHEGADAVHTIYNYVSVCVLVCASAAVNCRMYCSSSRRRCC